MATKTQEQITRLIANRDNALNAIRAKGVDVPLTATTDDMAGLINQIKGGIDPVTPNRALVSDASGEVAVSETTADELGYVHGVTSSIQGQLDEKISNNEKGHKNGVAPLNESGQIDSTYLPSYVDDVIEFDGLDKRPEKGESGKIYVNTETGLGYRWSGTTYTEVFKNSNTTYRLDKDGSNIKLIGSDGSTTQVGDSDTTVSSMEWITTQDSGLLALRITDSAGRKVSTDVIPQANGSTAGVVSRYDQTFNGVKTFTNTIKGNISGNAATASGFSGSLLTINSDSSNGGTIRFMSQKNQGHYADLYYVAINNEDPQIILPTESGTLLTSTQISDRYLSVNGTAAKATVLANARNLGVALGSTSAVTFDGGANVTNIPVSGVLNIANGGTGAATKDAAWTALGGGSVGKLNTGSSTTTFLRNDGQWVAPPNDNTDTNVTQANDTSGTAYPILLKNGTGTGSVTSSVKFASGITVTPSTGTINATTFSGNLNGNAATATKLASSVNINGVAFDGSKAITVADSTKLPLSGGTITGVLEVNSGLIVRGGQFEFYGPTPYIDFHFNNNSGDYTSRIIESSSGSLTLSDNLNVTGTLTVGGKSITEVPYSYNFSTSVNSLKVEQGKNDLNLLITPGAYYGTKAQLVTNMANHPSDLNYGGRVEIRTTTGPTYCFQIIYPNQDGVFYMRRGNDTSSWGGWYKFTGTLVGTSSN